MLKTNPDASYSAKSSSSDIDCPSPDDPWSPLNFTFKIFAYETVRSESLKI
jgi:hypothetical protein